MNIQTESAEFVSMSLFLDDQALLKSPPLWKLFDQDFSLFQLHQVAKENEYLSPQLWNMPEVFRKKLSAYSEHYFNEVNEQDRLVSILRYNFSNGLQISAKEILRHPLQKVVPRELLPLPLKSETVIFTKWPLLQHKEKVFISQSLIEVEEIVQALLDRVLTHQRMKKVKLFLQSKNHPEKALEIKAVEFDVKQELHWRVDFQEKADLESEFKLMSARKLELYFYNSIAVEPKEGLLLVHPWGREWSLLEENLKKIFGTEAMDHMRQSAMPTLDIIGEMGIKAFIKYLRSRPTPVEIIGGSRTLSSKQSQTSLLLDEAGSFQVQHEARVQGEKDLAKKGWSPKALLYFKVLSEGLPFLFGSDAKFLAARARGKRDWDLKILKHLGVIQYVLLEVLSYHFEGNLTDGRVVLPEEIFLSIHEKVQMILMSGTGNVLEKNMPLTDLCSRSVLVYFEEFITKTLAAIKAPESFYSESGEVILEGAVEREFHLIFELLKRLALLSSGETFRKSRTSFISKIWTGDIDADPDLLNGRYHFPKAENSNLQIQGTLEVVQGLLPFGFKIFYKGQALQELTDDEFSIDFEIRTDAQEKFFNWFELNPKFFLKGVEIDPQNMKSLGGSGVIEYEGRFFLVPRKQMPSLRRLENFWQKLQSTKKDATGKKSDDKVYQLPRHQILELLSLRASGVAIRGDHEWKKICEFYDQLGTNPEAIELPKTIKADLKPYQFTGVKWIQDLYKLRLGALLADDMGLGKTLQTLAFLESLREKNELGPVLVIVPSSLIYNWQSEIAKFTPNLPVEVYSGKERDAIGKKVQAKEDLIVIATYGLLLEHGDFLNQMQWKVLIFDEAQNLKNITTKRTSAARSLNAQFKICLTGTPMENHYGEFYSLVDILVPGSLGKIDDFRRQFVNTEIVSREEMDDLKLKIKPLLLRRTKREILDQLPEKQETKVDIAFEDRQREIYRDIAMAYNQKVKESVLTRQSEGTVQLQMLSGLLRFRQACSDPASLPNVRYDKVPPKIEALMDSVQEIIESGESALVFTQFLQTLEHTVKLMKAANIPVFALHGAIPAKQRQKVLADFNQTAGGAVLVMTLKTGGVGLNLTKASYVFHLEPWWNPSVENQATDRAHRLGQSRAVQVFKYIMHESLEEKIEMLKKRKDHKFQSLFSNTEKEVDVSTAGNSLSKDDFDLLLGLK